MVSRDRQPFRAALSASCGLYLAACVLPATKWWKPNNTGGGDYETAPGWVCLALGWLGTFSTAGSAASIGSFGQVAWLANPLALIGVAFLLLRRPTSAAAFGAAGVVLAALYIVDPPGRPGLPDLPQSGAWLWVFSLLSLTLAALVQPGNSQA